MTMRELGLCALMALLCAGYARAGRNDSAIGPTRPNILFILCDDLGIDDLHCYGRQDHHTPHLDRLAQQGMRFTSAYCAQPICSASRAAILTGKAPARLHLTTYLPGRPNASSQKVLHPEIELQVPLEERMVSNYLKAAGYATAAIGKWHVGGPGFGPLEHGFDMYHPGRANTKPSATEGGKGEYDLRPPRNDSSRTTATARSSSISPTTRRTSPTTRSGAGSRAMPGPSSPSTPESSRRSMTRWGG